MPAIVRPRIRSPRSRPMASPLKAADNSPTSAMGGIPKFVKDGNLTPDFYAVNTMQAALSTELQQTGGGKQSGVCRSGCGDDLAGANADQHRRSSERQRRELGVVQRSLASGARQPEQDSSAELPVPSSAVQLFRRPSAGNAGARGALEGRRHGRRRVHQGDRRRRIAAGGVL